MAKPWAGRPSSVPGRRPQLSWTLTNASISERDPTMNGTREPLGQGAGGHVAQGGFCCDDSGSYTEPTEPREPTEVLLEEIVLDASSSWLRVGSRHPCAQHLTSPHENPCVLCDPVRSVIPNVDCPLRDMHPGAKLSSRLAGPPAIGPPVGGGCCRPESPLPDVPSGRPGSSHRCLPGGARRCRQQTWSGHPLRCRPP